MRVHSPKPPFYETALLSPSENIDNLKTMVENAPTCYRAPKWPDPEFPRKIPKKYPRPEILDTQNLSQKYPENTEKIPPKYQKCAFLYFFCVLGVFSQWSRSPSFFRVALNPYILNQDISKWHISAHGAV